jgi:hypothetical protein
MPSLMDQAHVDITDQVKLFGEPMGDLGPNAPGQ